MRPKKLISAFFTASLSACVAVTGFAQNQYPQQPPPQYPPTQQTSPQRQYPPPQNPQGQYPSQEQGQYPPPQYPQQQPQGVPQGQYPSPQGQYGQPPLLAPQLLDQLVGPIALYPDSLLAEALTAATYSNEIPAAAAWATEHSYLRGDALADAIRQDYLPWDPSVLALLPFPNVLSYMAQNMSWTQALGNAVLAQRPDVMDAVQRLRQDAYNYGYLQSNQYERVIMAGPGDIEIVPVTPEFYYVPYYDPRIVFYRPRPGYYVRTAIRWGPGITIGASFAPWGWGGIGFGWRTHSIIVDNHPWARTWVNRGTYAHPYAEGYRRPEGPRVERHEVRRGERNEHRDRDHEEHRDHL